MGSRDLFDVMLAAKKLSPDDQLRLISFLAEQVRATEPVAKPAAKWEDVRGMWSGLLNGMDATEFVRRVRSGEDLGIETAESVKRED